MRYVATPLDTYREKLGAFAVWEPDPQAQTGLYRDLREALDLSYDDPRDAVQTWYALASGAARMVWQTLPVDMRDAALEGLGAIATEALNLSLGAADDLAGELGDAVGSVPIIGSIVEVVLEIINAALKLEEMAAKSDEETSADSYDSNRRYTIAAYDDPGQWIAQPIQVYNYLDMRYPHVALIFSLKPCMRQTEKSQRIWLGTDGAKDIGWCGDGRKIWCKQFVNQAAFPPGSERSDICDFQDKGDTCKRYSAISSLFFPWWNPAYPAEPLRRRTKSSVMDPNSLLISQQAALLSNPAANLRARGETVRKASIRIFTAFWAAARTKSGSAFRVGNLMPINSVTRQTGGGGDYLGNFELPVDGSVKEEKLGAAEGFFLREPDGVIEPYTSGDVAEWGVRSPGPPAQPNLGVSIGAYNAAMSATAAFFRARAEMLRNGKVLRTMLQKVKLEDLDPEVRDAVKWSADQGVVQPPIDPEYKLILQARPPRMTRPPARRSSALPVLAAGAAALFLLRRGR
jgi:hypothetical protein